MAHRGAIVVSDQAHIKINIHCKSLVRKKPIWEVLQILTAGQMLLHDNSVNFICCGRPAGAIENYRSATNGHCGEIILANIKCVKYIVIKKTCIYHLHHLSKHQLRRYFIKFDKVATSANTVQWSMQLQCLTLWAGVTWSEKQTQTQQVLFDNLHTVHWGWFRLKYLLSLQKKQTRKSNKRGSSQIPQPLWATLTKILKFQEARQMLQSNKKKSSI